MLFPGIFLARVLECLELRLAIKGVAVDVDLGVQAMDLPFRGDHEGVDLEERTIEFPEELREAHEERREILDLVAFKA